MILLNQNTRNEIALNINLYGEYDTYNLVFTHSLSQYVKEFVIDAANSNEYVANTRYCIIVLDNADMVHDGQYDLKIYGNNTELVYVGLVEVIGSSQVFPEYQSDNENGENYLYHSE